MEVILLLSGTCSETRFGGIKDWTLASSLLLRRRTTGSHSASSGGYNGALVAMWCISYPMSLFYRNCSCNPGQSTTWWHGGLYTRGAVLSELQGFPWSRIPHVALL